MRQLMCTIAALSIFGGARICAHAAPAAARQNDADVLAVEDAAETDLRFEPWSNRLCASEEGRLDQVAASLRGRLGSRLLILAFTPSDLGARRFASARLSTVDLELAKRGLVGEKIEMPASQGADARVVLRVTNLPIKRTPVKITPADGTGPSQVTEQSPAGDRRGEPLPLVPAGNSEAAPAGTIVTGPMLVGWHLRSAVPGRAWIVSPGELQLGPMEIKEGDEHPVLGRIERILRKGDRWIVQTAKGWIGGGPS